MGRAKRPAWHGPGVAVLGSFGTGNEDANASRCLPGGRWWEHCRRKEIHTANSPGAHWFTRIGMFRGACPQGDTACIAPAAWAWLEAEVGLKSIKLCGEAETRPVSAAPAAAPSQKSPQSQARARVMLDCRTRGPAAAHWLVRACASSRPPVRS